MEPVVAAARLDGITTQDCTIGARVQLPFMRVLARRTGDQPINPDQSNTASHQLAGGATAHFLVKPKAEKGAGQPPFRGIYL